MSGGRLRVPGAPARALGALGVGLLLAGCGTAPGVGASPPAGQAVAASPDSARVVAHAAAGGAASLGQVSYALDQLAPPPQATAGAPVLLAVIRATTTGAAGHLHTAGISLVDDRGGRWAPVPVPTYVPIDGLEGAPIEPGSGAAGTVAFRLPAGRTGVAVAIRSGGQEVVLDAQG